MNTRSAFGPVTRLDLIVNVSRIRHICCASTEPEHQLLTVIRQEISAASGKCHLKNATGLTLGLMQKDNRNTLRGKNRKLRSALLSGEDFLLVNHFLSEPRSRFSPATLRTSTEQGYNLFSRFPMKDKAAFQGLWAAKLDEAAYCEYGSLLSAC